MEKKMKPFVCVRPRNAKERIVLILFLIPVICGVAPVINIFNKPVLCCGIPLLMFWSIVVALMVILVTYIAYKLGV